MIVYTSSDDVADSSNDTASNEPENSMRDNEQQNNQRERKSMFLFKLCSI